MDLTRRRLVASVPLGSALALAGCVESADLESSAGDDAPTSDDDAPGSAGGDDTASGPHTTRPLYERWLPAEETYEYDLLEFAALEYDAVDPAAEPLFADLRDEMNDEVEFLSDPTAIDAFLVFSGGIVFEGSFDTDAVATALREEGENERTVGEFTVIDVTDRRTDAVAFDSSTLVLSERTLSATAQPVSTPSLLETGRGDAPRLLETDADAALLLESAVEARTDDPAFVTFRLEADATGEPREGNAMAWWFGPDRIQFVGGYLFPADAEADPETAAQAADAMVDLERFHDTDVSREGRVVTVSATVPTGDLESFEPEASDQEPVRAGVSLEYDGETVQVLITSLSQGANEVTLEILVDGDVAETVTEPAVGESYTVDVQSGSDVTIVGVHESGTRTVIATKDV
ncbi:hypothetical protein [Natronobiforma cellulositropha]|uniref:hypothetical protein n=1 Tax=Natronobiforma cellulositropha TaxID=1679076 RepID=UPI0021D600E3|nr:hypothetical protein [Natronobiforma cellulositropha]